MAERTFIHWLRQQLAHDTHLEVPVGDDAAVCQWPHGKLVVTTDMLLEESCFLLDAGPERIGKKAMSVNLSDMAAMAAKPRVAVISLGIPRDVSESWLQKLFQAMLRQAEAFETLIIGGDTNSWHGPLVINVTLIGQVTSQGPVTRTGAKPGDALLVTGPLGGSILGRHYDFTPRVNEALELHKSVALHAMIDLSDGLSTDLHHICASSHCGAELWADRIPVHPAAQQMPDSRTPLEHALNDGEDFELLFALQQKEADVLLAKQPLQEWGVTLSQIGRCTEDKAVVLTDGEKTIPLESSGYEHHFGEKSTES
ncbi:MAG TPA: thiamine-phosphate kinase [Gemmatales bacterium]|nr:thiamine-phosphate kinase [Gemmatales bacterium]